ncbi:BON domain-containing protein [Niveispirillum fermenti]|uniref:BON domain-containing protein n=2 Tax=Niveispirillum fermenti TaxID=1233113 RepID=UPI003A890461
MGNMRLMAPKGVGILMAAALALTAGCATTGGSAGAGDAPPAADAAPRKVSDRDLKAAIEKLWDSADDLDSRVRVEVRDGRALLTGRAANADERLLAVRLAWQVDGVAEVINEIGIGDESSLSDKATDAWITAQLRTRLMTDAEISSRNYTIETVNQTIYLMGRGRSSVELERVRNHARNIARVRQVVSHVQVPY